MRQVDPDFSGQQLLNELPAPPPALLAHSAQLSTQIQARLDRNGTLSFAEYMQMALYEPGLGYYSAGLEKFGEGGDFTTAPQISPLFAQCVARQCASVLAELDAGSLLEFGAGSGVFAKDLLDALARLDALPSTYYILEVSAELRDRQRAYLRQQLPDLFSRIRWLDKLPQQFVGVMLANEVLDAMPVHRFQYRHGQLQELRVAATGERFGYQEESVSCELAQPLAQVVEHYAQHWPGLYQSELNLQLAPWFKALSESLTRGLLLIFDYGYTGAEYYHAQRNEGSLLCHYRHRVHSNPFILVGLQDITASVDFSAVAQAAYAAGFELRGYTTQAHFLIGSGIDQVLQESWADDAQYLARASEAKTLVLPGEMGERFKVFAASKGIDTTLQGFSLRNLLDRL